MAKLEICLSYWDEKKARRDGSEYEGDTLYSNIDYPHVPRVGEYIECRLFSKFKSVLQINEVTYCPDRVKIFIKTEGDMW